MHRQQQIHGSSYHLSDKRASRLVRTHDSASSTWPSDSAGALDPSEAVESVPDAGRGISKSDLENSTDEAATRVGLSSKGSKKLAGFWGAYSKALEEHPIRVKSATSFFGFLLGDAVAQLVVGNPYNYLRTARMVIFGILMDGPIGDCLSLTALNGSAWLLLSFHLCAAISNPWHLTKINTCCKRQALCYSRVADCQWLYALAQDISGTPSLMARCILKIQKAIKLLFQRCYVTNFCGLHSSAVSSLQS